MEEYLAKDERGNFEQKDNKNFWRCVDCKKEYLNYNSMKSHLLSDLHLVCIYRFHLYNTVTYIVYFCLFAFDLLHSIFLFVFNVENDEKSIIKIEDSR